MFRATLSAFVAVLPTLLPLASATPGVRPPPGAAEETPVDRPVFGVTPKIKPVSGLTAALFAKEPLVADPVAFCFDDRGRLYIAESLRQERGIEDNRSSKWWLLDDLQSQTVEDRLRMYEKWADKREGGMKYYSKYEDRVRRIEDTDGDGRADRGTMFATPFNEPLDGTGAGIIAREGDVWYTNIPTLWRLRDRNDDGVAETKDRVWQGFGVRVALRGHDMHGLAWGPDGKLYWSIGDRGYHVTLPDGRVFADPRSGAVFRCNADGSRLELFCTGLRNPQELAFDDYGNLFTGDNNSDAGDKARIVYCVEAGETGWRMDYQTLEGTNVRGPWNQEETWAMRPDLAPDRVKEYSQVQPAYSIPPLSHVGSGPSGLVHYPGLGLPSRYDGAFFLCDFLGGDAYSRVLSFKVEPVGAGFKVVDVHPFIENVLPTDVDFGYDGKMYVSDWGGGWYSKGFGEIYTVWDPVAIQDPRIVEVGQLFREGFRGRDPGQLRLLLGHADQRVRLRAQFALAENGPRVVPLLADEAAHGTNRLARIHAIWGLGIIAGDGFWPDAVRGLVPLLDDVDSEIRAQSAKVIGEAKYRDATSQLVRLLSDDVLRVRYFASMALGRLGAKEAHAPIVAMLAENDGKDVFLRHAGVAALTSIGDREQTMKLASEPQAELRLCTVLVLRRWKDASVARLLQDSDERVVIEAARAINDVPITDAMPRVAELSRRFVTSASGAQSAPSVFRREIWTNVKGASESKLESDPAFGRPADVSDTGSTFEGKADLPKELASNYLQRVSGVVTPPVSGPYVFQITSDDQSVLFLSPDEDPSKKSKIASVEGYTARGEWNGQPDQSSQPVMLEAGKRYYVEARQGEGGGDDFVAVGWIRPDGNVERPIGSGVTPPFTVPLLRRIINACVRSDEIASATALADLARSDAVPEAMRVEALSALAEWSRPGPRDRVNGSFRAVDATKRDLEAYRTVLKQKVPGLVQFGSPAVKAAARELANTSGIVLDGTANFNVVIDAKQPASERVACLRQLCADHDKRADEAISLALAADAAPLRSEARAQLALRDPAKGAPLLREGLKASDPSERQAAMSALTRAKGDELDAIIADSMTSLEAGQVESALRLDTLRAAQSRAETPLAARAETWLKVQDAVGPYARYAITAEGGDASRGHALVQFHTSATCLKCHTVAGVGGDAAPKLDGVGTRLTRAQIIESLVNPNAVVAKGFGDHSAMPPMGPILTMDEIRDIVEYLSTLK